MKKIIITGALLLIPSFSFADTGKDSDEWFKKCDTNNDGVVTKEEFIQEKTRKFEKYDKNKDGKLTKEEHREMVMEKKEKMKDD